MSLQALEVVERYYAELSNMPVMPLTTSRAVRDLLLEPLPQQRSTIEDALATIRDIVYPLSRHNGHPRFFGYVASPGTAAAAIGEFLAAALNANVTSWRSAPAAAEMEHLTINWLKRIIDYHAGSSGLLVSGGSMANFCGLEAARTAADPRLEMSEAANGLPCESTSPMKDISRYTKRLGCSGLVLKTYSPSQPMRRYEWTSLNWSDESILTVKLVSRRCVSSQMPEQ